MVFTSRWSVRATPASAYHGRVSDVSEFPGNDVFSQGSADLRSGRKTPQAFLVSLARTRLVAAGLDVPQGLGDSPAHQLYDLLAAEHAESAHGRYNALLLRMASFARAAEHAVPR